MFEPFVFGDSHVGSSLLILWSCVEPPSCPSYLWLPENPFPFLFRLQEDLLFVPVMLMTGTKEIYFFGPYFHCYFSSIVWVSQDSSTNKKGARDVIAREWTSCNTIYSVCAICMSIFGSFNQTIGKKPFKKNAICVVIVTESPYFDNNDKCF